MGKGKKTFGNNPFRLSYWIFSIWNEEIRNGNEHDNASSGYCKGQDTITKVIISPGIEEIETGGASRSVFA